MIFNNTPTSKLQLPNSSSNNMNTSILQKPIPNLLLLLSSSLRASPSLLLRPTRRYESSTRRTKKKLHVAPAPIFQKPSQKPSRKSKSDPPTLAGDYIVHTPPPAAPSVYHTPTPFLPAGDIRRTLYAEAKSAEAAEAAGRKGRAPRPPPAVRPPYEKKYHVTPADVQQMRTLRAEDPARWTRERLAEKFDCSAYFVGIVAGASEEWKAEGLRKAAAVRARWGARRRNAREERGKRRLSWLRDE